MSVRGGGGLGAGILPATNPSLPGLFLPVGPSPSNPSLTITPQHQVDGQDETQTEMKRKSPPPASPEPEEADEPERKHYFFNVQLKDGILTNAYSFDNESSAAIAWMKFEFWSRPASTRHRYANETFTPDGGMEAAQYKVDILNWPDLLSKYHYSAKLEEYFREWEEESNPDQSDPESEYNILLEQGKVTLADVAEDRYRRHMFWKYPASGNQEAWELYDLLEDPHKFRDEFLSNWVPFRENDNKTYTFPVPEYKVTDDKTMTDLIKKLTETEENMED